MTEEEAAEGTKQLYLHIPTVSITFFLPYLVDIIICCVLLSYFYHFILTSGGQQAKVININA